MEGSKIAKTTLKKKKKVVKLTLSDFKTCYKVMVIKICGIGIKIARQIKTVA